MASNGQAVKIAGLFGTLIFGAFIWLIVRRVSRPVLDEASQRATNETVSQGNQWLGDILVNVPFIFVGIGVVGIVAAAVYQSQLP